MERANIDHVAAEQGQHAVLAAYHDPLQRFRTVICLVVLLIGPEDDNILFLCSSQFTLPRDHALEFCSIGIRVLVALHRSEKIKRLAEAACLHQSHCSIILRSLHLFTRLLRSRCGVLIIAECFEGGCRSFVVSVDHHGQGRLIIVGLIRFRRARCRLFREFRRHILALLDRRRCFDLVSAAGTERNQQKHRKKQGCGLHDLVLFHFSPPFQSSNDALLFVFLL